MDCLTAAAEKIANAMRHIDDIKSRKFPHEESDLALDQILAELDQSKSLIADATRSSNIKLRKQTAFDANITLIDILWSLGFVVNSSSTSSPLEIHDPLKQLINIILDDKHSLVFSFTWDYSPFIFLPDTLKSGGFIIISMPASEAENALIIPAAAHEIGHSVFAIYENEIKNLVGREVDKQFAREDTWLKSQIETYALLQCEEVFADSVGVILFGQSYFNAMWYLISPKVSNTRHLEYPSLVDRIQYMIKTARLAKIDIREGFEEYFDAEDTHPTDEEILRHCDSVVAVVSSQVIDRVVRHCAERGLPSLSADTSQIENDFRNGVPASNAANIGDVLNAGWNVYLQNVWDKDIDRLGFISELVLKTFEVMELSQYR